MKKNLFLHIGSHKTGTTSIQKVLLNNYDYLKKYNFSFLDKDFEGNKTTHGNAKSWISTGNGLNTGEGASIKDIDKLCKNLSGLEKENIIMSTEEFSWFFQKTDLEKFKQELDKYFKTVKIIVYLRRQDEQIISHHQQGSKIPKCAERRFYGSEPRAIPFKTISVHHYYLDYYKKLNMWKDIFGKENLIVRVFNKESLIDKDIVSDFFSVLNIPKPKVNLTKLNESNGFEKTKIGHMLNDYIQDKNLRNFIRDNLDNEGKLLPSRNDAIRYFNHYKKSNDLLEKEFNIKFTNDFSKYPENDNDIWDEDSAQKAISTILNSVNSYYENLSFFEFIKTYIKRLIKSIN